mmetsp:Transcript_44034/g.81856  ORF Transcript_44034/g.81856 Transcript_44034/m.81856 type:complete len:250 (+) Transcript_44034:55-804(+)
MWQTLGLSRTWKLGVRFSARQCSSAVEVGTIRNLIAWYSNKLQTHPITTKCISGGVLFAIGDVICQHVQSDSSKGTDLVRTSKMVLWGGLLNPIMGHIWYAWIEKVVTQTGAVGVVLKVGADQLLMTPIVANPLFFTMNALYDGQTGVGIGGFQGIENEFRQKYVPTMEANLKFWPCVHLITYSVIPLHYRVIWVTAAGTVWSIFLSFMANDFHEDKEHGTEPAGKRADAKDFALSRRHSSYIKIHRDH